MVFWGLLTPNGVVAQSEIGLSFGVTHSRGAGDEGDPTETKSAFYARAFVDTYFTDFFSVQVGLAFSEKRAGRNDGSGKIVFDQDYVELPVLAMLHLGSKAGIGGHIFAGPTLSVPVQCEISLGSPGGPGRVIGCGETNLVGGQNSLFDVGATTGGGLKYSMSPNTSISMDISYTFGLRTVIHRDIVDLDLRNRALLVSASFSVPLALFSPR